MKEIIIHDVGMRDGLQIEKKIVPTEEKMAWIKELIDSSIDIIQVGSFVHPGKVPQMADTDDLFKELIRIKKPEVLLSGLVLNERGLERGMACGVEMFCMGVSASETHSKKNTGMTTEEATTRIIAMAEEAVRAGKKVQVSVQSAFGCGFEGNIPEERVLTIVKKYLEKGLKNISLADTAGQANPQKVLNLYGKLLELDKTAECACHFHNPYGLAMLNTYIAMKSGVKSIETAFGGLGGCPFTKSPAGNLSTEDFVHLLHQLNMRKDIDIQRLIDLAKRAGEFLEKSLPGAVHNVGVIK